MFSLREITKIRLCRMAFVVLCVAPTCAVLAWSVVVRLPAYRLAHERAIASRLGLHVQLAAASSPRPGTLLYEWLELSDPDTRQLLARLPFVEVRQSADEVHVRLPYPAIVNGTRLDAFWKLAHDQCRPAHAGKPLRFEAQNLTLHLSDGDQSFTDLDGTLENAAERPQLKIGFRPAQAGGAGAARAELTIAWHRDSTPAGSMLQFTTGTAGLPCSIVGSIWPGVRRFGRASQFQGRILVSEQGSLWKAKLAGRLSDVDLDALVGGRFPHTLTGPADVHVEAATIQDGRIESMTGKVLAGPGAISRSLVEAAQAHLHVQATSEAIRGPGGLTPYDQLAAAFQLDAHGLSLRGAIPAAPGAILAHHRTILAREPAVARQPMANLVRTLVPHSEVQVPATRETDALTRLLPLASIVSPAAGRDGLPQAKVRLRSDGQRRN
jgi:hypothetical protein